MPTTKTPVYAKIGGLPTIDGIPVYPIFGAMAGPGSGQMGIHSSGDIISAATLVTQTADGLDLNTLFAELTEAFSLWNTERTGVSDLLSFKVTVPGEAVPQSIGADSFERATEFGVPTAQGPPVEAALLGYDFIDWDKRTSFTWKFLRESTRSQVDSVITAIMHADNRLTTGRILRRVLSPVPTHNEHGWACRGLYCADGAVPPPFLGNEFDDTATMYVPSGAAVIDSADIEDGVSLVQSHGFGINGNGQMLILANPVEAKAIRSFRAGQPSRPSGPSALYDWIPSVNKPPYLTEKTLVGQPVSDNFDGVKVLGSYDVSLLIESPFVPEGYVIITASGGRGSPINVVGFREHALPEHRGLRLIAGQGIYPLVDSFAARAFGVGVRHRAGACVIQVTSGSTYTPPPDSAIPI